MSTLFQKPEWATSGITSPEPTAGKQNTGWVGGVEKPPFQFFNWLANRTYQWIDNLADVAASYADASEFISKAEPGDVGTIVPDVGAFEPYGFVAGSGALSGQVLTIDSDGEYIYIGVNNSTSTFVERWTKQGTFVQSYTAPRIGTPNRVRSNGSVVVAIYNGSTNTFATCWDADTGAILGTEYDAGAFAGTVSDIAIDAYRAYIIKSDTNLSALPLSDLGGAADWTQSISNGNSVETDGVRVYVGSQGAGGGTFNASSRVFSFLSVDGSILGEWVATGPSNVINKGLSTDGSRLLVVLASNDVALLSAVANEQGGLTNLAHATIEQIGVSVSIIIRGCFIDPMGSVVIFGDNASQSLIMWGDRLSSLALAYGEDGAGEAIVTAYSDGDVIVYSTILSADYFVIYDRPSARVTRWYRADPDNDAFMPQRQLAFPIGG